MYGSYNKNYLEKCTKKNVYLINQWAPPGQLGIMY